MTRMVKEGKGRVPLKAHREGLRVARLLAKKIEEKGLSVRRVEELTGWGQKTLQQILNGEQPIRVSHVAAVLSTLGLPVGEFYLDLAKSAKSEEVHSMRAEPTRETAEDRRTPEEIRKETRHRRLAEALLEKCRALRFSDLEGMILTASLAVALTERLEAKRDSAEYADLRARAWTELGNAYRIADDLNAAEAAFARALEYSGHGTGDSLLLIRLADVMASLRAEQRQFDDAFRLLDWVYTFHRQLGDRHMAGRALISKGSSVFLALDPERAIPLFGQGIALVDTARDPKLILSAVHGLLISLVDCGRMAEARALLETSRDLYRVYGETLNLIRSRWLEGRIAAGLGEDANAEQAFLEARASFQAADLPYGAALVSLDLAALWLREGRTAKLKDAVNEMVAIFRARNIHREAIGALLILKKALDKDRGTAALLQAVAAELRQLEGLPARKSQISG